MTNIEIGDLVTSKHDTYSLTRGNEYVVIETIADSIVDKHTISMVRVVNDKGRSQIYSTNMFLKLGV